MKLSQDTIVSAQAMLVPASGKAIDGDARITAENIGDYAPSAAALAHVAQAFRRLGFHTDTAGGMSVSVTGAVKIFERVFHTSLKPGPKGGVMSAPKDARPSLDLPLDGLPPEIRGAIQAVTFSAPPDFGPGGGFA